MKLLPRMNAIKRLVAGTPLEPPARWIYHTLAGTKDYTYNRETYEVMRRVLKPNSNFVDVGANTGSVLKQAIKLSPAGKHWAFEAIPELAHNLASAFPDVTVVSAAVSDKSGNTSFNVHPTSGLSGIKLMANDMTAETNVITVPTVSLDEAIGKAQIDMIKIDVNGGEVPLFVGAQKLITRCHPVIVFEHGLGGADQYGNTPDQVFDILSRCGMKLSTMKRYLHRDSPLSRQQFCDHFYQGKDFMFMAVQV